MVLTDLQERALGNLTTSAIQFLKYRKHLSTPSVARVDVRAEREANAPCFLAGCLKQPFHAFQAAFNLRTVHVVSLRRAKLRR
jgi:hypothetical protein